MCAYMHLWVWTVYVPAHVLYCMHLCVTKQRVPLEKFLAHIRFICMLAARSFFFFFFFCGFRSEQLLNGHSSSETGHWEAQRGLARVSALPSTHAHTHTHWRQAHTDMLWQTPGKACIIYGSESEMWPFSRCFPSQTWLWMLCTLLNLTTMENKARHTCIILGLMWQQEKISFTQYGYNSTVAVWIFADKQYENALF